MIGVRWLPLLVVVLAAAAPRPVAADESLDPDGRRAVAATPNRVNLRIGGATTDDTGRPTICADVHVIAGLGIEACGTGQGVIHDELGSEMAHFRATWTVLERATPRGVGRFRAGAGFAELQVGIDHPGFHFGSPDRVDRGSVAGPEAAVQGQWLVPLGVGVEAIASLTAGVAAFAKADELVVPKAAVQPFVSFELGVGW
jgi:hypothetical protein